MSQERLRAAIIKRRHELGLTQLDVARRIGMSRLTYHRLETGSKTVRPGELGGILDALGLDLDTIKGLDIGYVAALKGWLDAARESLGAAVERVSLDRPSTGSGPR